MLGPFPLSFTTPELHINRFGVIPKAQKGEVAFNYGFVLPAGGGGA